MALPDVSILFLLLPFLSPHTTILFFLLFADIKSKSEENKRDVILETIKILKMSDEEIKDEIKKRNNKRWKK